MNTSLAPSLTWDTCAIAGAYATVLQEEDPTLTDDAALTAAYTSSFIYDDAWRDLLDDLTNLLRQISPEGCFHAEGRNLGWRRLSAKGTFHARNGEDFLRQLLPNTDCTFSIVRQADTLRIINSHHDAPTDELYVVTAATPDQQEIAA